MWHTHQLYPDSYCKDMKELIGGVLPHNDSDPDKSKGSRLDTGFTETTKKWEQTFGFSYWKAGAMNRGDMPTPVTRVPYTFNDDAREFNKTKTFGQHLHFQALEATEVLLEFVDIKNLPNERKENLVVAISKSEPDKLFKTKRWLGISSAASKDKIFAYFECESAGEFLLELMSYSPTFDELKPKRQLKLLGSCSLSLEDMFGSQSQLWINKWISLDPVSSLGNAEPVLLHVSMSFSPPMRAPQVFQLGSCQNVKHDLVETTVLDCSEKKVFSLQKRIIIKDATKGLSNLSTQMFCITDSGEKHAVVEFQENNWTVKGMHGSFKFQKSTGNDGSLFVLLGYNKIVKLFPGRRLQPGLKQSNDEKEYQDLTTMVEFSNDYPYGRAVGLINSKSRTIKVMDEFVVLPSIALAFLLSENVRGDEQIDFSIVGEERVNAKGSSCCVMCSETSSIDEEELVNAKGSVCCGLNCETSMKADDCMDMILELTRTKIEGNGAQCIGQLKAQCIGQCTKCDTDMVKAQCIGQCTKCSDTDMVKAADCMDMVKAVDCMDMVKAVDCMDKVKAADCMNMMKADDCMDKVKVADCMDKIKVVQSDVTATITINA
ncbi:hypothetical protein KSS87_019100 [Heliosperma pusillum]|nr:hypothetical protein KSS87_019100 [Heliosperma pusillum]